MRLDGRRSQRQAARLSLQACIVCSSTRSAVNAPDRLLKTSVQDFPWGLVCAAILLTTSNGHPGDNERTTEQHRDCNQRATKVQPTAVTVADNDGPSMTVSNNGDRAGGKRGDAVSLRQRKRKIRGPSSAPERIAPPARGNHGSPSTPPPAPASASSSRHAPAAAGRSAKAAAPADTATAATSPRAPADTPAAPSSSSSPRDAASRAGRSACAAC